MSSTLGISWLYGEFVAVGYKGGKLSQSWEAPYPVNSIDEFEEALVQAKSELSIKKYSQLFMVYESEQQRHSFVEMPPMSKKDTVQYLSRHVDTEKSFEGDAKWSYRGASKGNASKGVLLHIMPNDFFEKIKSTCEKHKLELVRFLPNTEVISHRYSKIESQQNDTIVFVALFKRFVEIVVTDVQGNSSFVRELAIEWDTNNLDRLKLDIERTLLYTKQQNAYANKIVLLGIDSPQVAQLIASSFNVQVDTLPESTDAVFWANEAIKIPNSVTSNYIPHLLQNKLVSKSAVNIARWVAVGSIIGAVVSTFITDAIRIEGNENLKRNVDSLQSKVLALQADYDALRNEELRYAALIEKPDPIAPLFLYDLSNLVKDSMYLSKASIEVAEGEWKFILEGANNPTLANSLSDLEALESALKAAPWFASVSENWRTEWLEKLRQGKANDDGLISFTLEGTL